MFYSPTKEFVRFSTYRTAEINALRERIQKEKVTTEKITTTQKRLEKLRKQYEDLQKEEEHSDLKNVLQNSEAAIIELQRQITISEKECTSKRQQLEQLEKFRLQLQDCDSIEEQKLRCIVSQKEKLSCTYDSNQSTLLQKKAQLQNYDKQYQKQRKIKEDISAAQAQLDKKWEQLRVIQESCQEQQQKVGVKIAEQKQNLGKIHRELQFGQQEAEKCQLQKKNSEITSQFYQTAIQQMQKEKIAAAENQEAKDVQGQIGQILGQILQNLAEEGAKVEKQELAYQRKIKQVLTRVSEQQEAKCKLQEKIAIVKGNLKLFKQKNDSLKTKMNAIFKNDAQLMKTIASKKVYPHMKEELLEIVKKSSVQPFLSKQNQASLGKHQKTESVLQARLFGQNNRIL